MYIFDMFEKSILIYTDMDLYAMPMCLYDVLIGCVVMCYVCIYGHGHMYVWNFIGMSMKMHYVS